jgi:hypothetical protein
VVTSVRQGWLIGADEGSVRLLGSAVPGEAFGAAWPFALLTLDRAARAPHPDTIPNNLSADPESLPIQPKPRPTHAPANLPACPPCLIAGHCQCSRGGKVRMLSSCRFRHQWPFVLLSAGLSPRMWSQLASIRTFPRWLRVRRSGWPGATPRSDARDIGTDRRVDHGRIPGCNSAQLQAPPQWPPYTV